jgi:hypothetical protein
MVEVAENSPVLSGDALIRTGAALAWIESKKGAPVSTDDQQALSARLDMLIDSVELADG